MDTSLQKGSKASINERGERGRSLPIRINSSYQETKLDTKPTAETKGHQGKPHHSFPILCASVLDTICMSDSKTEMSILYLGRISR